MEQILNFSDEELMKRLEEENCERTEKLEKARLGLSEIRFNISDFGDNIRNDLNFFINSPNADDLFDLLANCTCDENYLQEFIINHYHLDFIDLNSFVSLVHELRKLILAESR